jgi:integrase
MAHTIGRLTALKITRISQSGMYADGGGLYLQVTSAAAKSWIFRYSAAGRGREMGLGSLSAITLADARVLAAGYRAQRAAGLDPIAVRGAERERQALEAAKAITFSEAAERYIAAHAGKWRNDKHKAQWRSTLATYAEPIFGNLPVQAVDTGLVLNVLEPIWNVKRETASRLRGRIENVLDWATARGLRQGENPARWKGHLKHLLAARTVRAVRHHPAMAYADVPAFMERLRTLEGISPRALEFTILTVARTGETIGALWSEINFTDKIWTVPANRMKAGAEHRVPLCDSALAILREMERTRVSDSVFPGWKHGKPLSNMAMAKVLERMGLDSVTIHGFRSSFRDWAAEQTACASEVVEKALAHTIHNEVEAAYRRGDLLDKRRQLLTAWEGYCATPRQQRGEVVVLRAS